MLRFFRQIRQHLLTQNKFSKYLLYAVGEILLVVIGILLALQFNTWKEEQVERKKETEILIQLEKEFQKNQDQIHSKIELHQIIVQSSLKVLRLIDQPTNSILKDSLLYYLSATTTAPTFDPATGVTADLINSGKLYLIRNDSLRHMVSSWNGDILFATEEELVWREVRDAHYIPFLKELISYRDLFDVSNRETESNSLMNYGNVNEYISIGKSRIDTLSAVIFSPSQLMAFEDQIAGVISLNHISKIQMIALESNVKNILAAISEEQKKLEQ